MKNSLLILLFSLWGVNNSSFGQSFHPKISVDNYSGINLVGSFQDSLIFNNAVVHSSSSSFFWNPAELFLAHLDTNNNLKWCRLFHNTDFSGMGVTSDKYGNVYILVDFRENFTLDTSTVLSAAYSGSPSGESLVLAKYDSVGNLKWYRQSVGVSNNSYLNLGVDTIGNIYFGGQAAYSITFGYDTLFYPSTYGAFFAKFDSAGNNVWLTKMIGPGEVFDFQSDMAGNSFVVGELLGMEYFGTDSANGDGYIAKCSSSGIPQWIKSIGGYGNLTSGCSVGVGPNGKPTVLGLFEDSLYITGYPPLPASGTQLNIFLANYNISGGVTWRTKAYESNAFPPDNYSIRVDHRNNIYFAGYESGSMTVGTTPVSIGMEYVIKLDSMANVLCSIILTGCSRPELTFGADNSLYINGSAYGSFIINGDTFTTSNNTFYIAKFDENCGLLWVDTISNPLTPYLGYFTPLSIQGSNVEVYPNPAHDVIDIRCKKPIPNGAMLQLYNIQGQLLFSTKFANQIQQIDLTNYPQGVYLLEVTDGYDKVIKKIIKT